MDAATVYARVNQIAPAFRKRFISGDPYSRSAENSAMLLTDSSGNMNIKDHQADLSLSPHGTIYRPSSCAVMDPSGAVKEAAPIDK